jgi:RNA polymerase sigma-70 factor (ECF subfamily)
MKKCRQESLDSAAHLRARQEFNGLLADCDDFGPLLASEKIYRVGDERPWRRGHFMNALIPSANDLAMNGGFNKMTEELLVSAAKSGDAVAFVELSKRHSNKILRRAYRIVKNWQDAEDVLQEALMRAFLHMKEFEERSSFSSWLTRIAINSALMSLRKKRGYIETSMEVITDDHGFQYRWEPKDPAESPESHCSRREREELLEGAIQQLPPRLRQVVQMKIIDGRSGEEVSQTLGISVAAAKSRLARAKTALRISLCSGD